MTPTKKQLVNGQLQAEQLLYIQNTDVDKLQLLLDQHALNQINDLEKIKQLCLQQNELQRAEEYEVPTAVSTLGGAATQRVEQGVQHLQHLLAFR